MDVSTFPSLDLDCSQANTKLDSHYHMYIERGVNKTKYGHEGIVIVTSSYDLLCSSNNLSTMSSMNQKLYCEPTNYNLSH